MSGWSERFALQNGFEQKIHGKRHELKIYLNTTKQMFPLMHERIFGRKVLTSIFRPDLYGANNV